MAEVRRMAWPRWRRAARRGKLAMRAGGEVGRSAGQGAAPLRLRRAHHYMFASSLFQDTEMPSESPSTQNAYVVSVFRWRMVLATQNTVQDAFCVWVTPLETVLTPSLQRNFYRKHPAGAWRQSRRRLARQRERPVLRGGEDGSSSDVRPASSTRRCADPGRSRARLSFGRAREGAIAVVALRCSSASCDGWTLLTAAMVTAAVARSAPPEALSAGVLLFN